MKKWIAHIPAVVLIWESCVFVYLVYFYLVLAVGDFVKEDDVVCEIETDKVFICKIYISG